jgi:magnesium chelatase subunit D
LRTALPFSAVVGQEELKLALVLMAVDPALGGVLIAGERGTAKSTVARGLAALLPAGPGGAAAPFVELPLNATEDRVAGSLDLSKVLQDGRTELRPGLLAQAHGGVLYVDEVNLLPDPIVDLLLDAAASGWVSVERDGVSAGQEARFMLVGTMNPEEGALRPQLRDRFGLSVTVRGLAEEPQRIAALRARLAFDDDPAAVIAQTQAAEQALRERIVAARTRLKSVRITDEHLAATARVALAHQLDGIRGDLAIIKAARALAAWQAADEITGEHIGQAAELAVGHRTGRHKPAAPPRAPPRPSADGSAGLQPGNAMESASKADTQPVSLNDAPAAERARVELETPLIGLARQGRRGAGAPASRRVVGSGEYDGTGTLDVRATLVAAGGRGARVTEGRVGLEAQDLRQHERCGPGRAHVLFVVDASGSMAAHRRLAAAKGAALGLLTSSEQRRDAVALMAFRGEGADLVLPFTRQVAAVEQALREVPTGGRTPLARALIEAGALLRSCEPALCILFTDGRANVSTDGSDPWRQALSACAALRESCAGAVVIDCELGPVTLGRAAALAGALGAECVPLASLDSDALALRVQRRLEPL